MSLISLSSPCALALAFVLSTSAASAAEKEWKTLPLAPGLEAWKPGHGAWYVAADAGLNATNDALLAARPGEGAVVNGPTGRTGHLVSKEEFADAEVHIEFMVPKKSNSGVYLMGRYEVQVFDSWGVAQPKYSDCGGIYGNDHYAGSPPSTNAATPPGTWQTFDIVFRAPTFDAAGKKTANARFERVLHNGVQVQKDVDVPVTTRAAMTGKEAATGPLYLQGDHGPVAYRNIRIRALE